jgi:hypothetical protein
MDPTAGKTLVWQDDFNRWKPAWSTRAVAHVDGQCARGHASCARTANGEMILSVKEDPDNPGLFLAGHVGTGGRKTFGPYGYYEAKVSFPDLRGTLCGWWLAPADDYVPDDPATPANERGSEIDIAENGGFAIAHHTIWWRDIGQNAGEFHTPPASFSTDMGLNGMEARFHRYGVLWEPSGYTFFIDGIEVGTITEGLSEGRVFLVLSIKIPKYAVEHLRKDQLHEYKMRVKRVRAWA